LKIYIAGPITNDLNYKSRFAKAEEKLLAKGFTVINPVKDEGFTYKEYIDMGLNELMRCDAVYMLKGWKHSNGAMLEYVYAKVTNMKIFKENPDE
jgi:hypothetical protein